MKIRSIEQDGTSHTIVEFTKRDGNLVGKWSEGSEVFQQQIESGLVMTEAGVFTPKDGDRFLDAARLYFSRSSQIDVVD